MDEAFPLFETVRATCRRCRVVFDPRTVGRRLAVGGYCSWSCERRAPVEQRACAACGKPARRRKRAGRPPKYCDACSGRKATHLASECVYFIRNTITGNVKVGTSSDPRSRFVSLQIGNDCPLELLGWIEGGVEREASIHAALEAWRIRGEWFSPESMGTVSRLLGPTQGTAGEQVA